MEAWFREYYEDPANMTSRLEGEFVYLWGGPYDPLDELGNEFGDIVPEDRIEELAKELRQEHIKWAPTRKQRQIEEEALRQDPSFFLAGQDAPIPAAGGSAPIGASPIGGSLPGSTIFSARGALEATVVRLSEPDASAFIVSSDFPVQVNVDPPSIEQRPAAFRFGLRDGKIDVLPEPTEPVDREFALDTYREVVAKARELQERLRGTNSAGRFANTIERLLTTLGARFEDLRPGVLLSRSRDIDADRVAFARELLPDTIAMMDGTAQTLRDLLASFPEVRLIEAEVLALDLDRSADAIPAIRGQMAAITAAAEKSGAVTPEAISALTQNDAAIEDATNPVAQRSLVADKLLVLRNFAGAVVKGIATARAELGELAGNSWQAIKVELPKGFGAAARVAPLIGLMTLAGVVAGPLVGVASVVPTFLSKALKDALRNGLKDTLAREKLEMREARKGRKRRA
jgi:hypothetical protein